MVAGDAARGSHNLTSTIEYELFTNVDLIASAPISSTVQREDLESFESCITSEARWHVTQYNWFNIMVVLKGDMPLFQNLETKEWHDSTRIRLNAEATIAINGAIYIK